MTTVCQYHIHFFRFPEQNTIYSCRVTRMTVDSLLFWYGFQHAIYGLKSIPNRTVLQKSNERTSVLRGRYTIMETFSAYKSFT